jgi:hypothetical protein
VRTGDSYTEELVSDVEELLDAVRAAASEFVRAGELAEARGATEAAFVCARAYERLQSIEGADVPHREIIGGEKTKQDLLHERNVCVRALRRIEGVTGLHGFHPQIVGDVNNIAHNALDEIGDDRDIMEKMDACEDCHRAVQGGGSGCKKHVL